MTSIVRQLATELLRQRPPAEHPLFVLLRNSALSPAEERAIGLEVLHVTAAFPRFLAALAARVEELDRRLPLISNLMSEHGGDDPRAAHVLTYRRFLMDLDVPPEVIDRSRPGLAALVYCRALFDLCAHQPLAEARAALAVIEDVVAHVSPIVQAYARARKTAGTGTEGSHFALHAELDLVHADDSYAEAERDYATAPGEVERGLELGFFYQLRFYGDLVERHVDREKWALSSHLHD
jgi:pyrroloquinoline quinone (PQQ) biosynthesis protein C